MADELSLKDALGMFVQGTRDLATSKALLSANEKVQQVKMSGVKDTEQRLQLGQIAQNLVAEMSAYGSTAQAVEQARLNFTPKTYQSADAARLDAMLTGNEGLATVADAADKQSMNSELVKMKAQERIRMDAAKEQELFREKMQERAFAQQDKLEANKLEREGIKANKKKMGELKQADIDFESNSSAALRNIQELKKTVGKSGNYESNSIYSPASDPKAAADLSQNFLDTAIAYAKIVDPTSVAREGEVETAKKYAIPSGLTISNKTTLQALHKMEQKIKERMKDRRKLGLMNRQELADLGDETVNQPAAALNLKSLIRPRK